MKTIKRINESQLNRIVAGVVKQYLNEGKVINHKPFDEYIKDKENNSKKFNKRMNDYVSNDPLYKKFKKAFILAQDNDDDAEASDKSTLCTNAAINALDKYHREIDREIEHEKRNAYHKREERSKNRVGQIFGSTPMPENSGHILPREALFAMKQCEQKIGVNLDEEEVQIKNVYDEFIGHGAGVSYYVVTASYEDGPGENLSHEVNKFLTSKGFEYVGSDGNGYDERDSVSYKIYYWIYSPTKSYYSDEEDAIVNNHNDEFKSALDYVLDDNFNFSEWFKSCKNLDENDARIIWKAACEEYKSYFV